MAKEISKSLISKKAGRDLKYPQIMPLRPNPMVVEAVVKEVVRNSPLLTRKRIDKESPEKAKKKGLKKIINGMVASVRNVITGVIPTLSVASNSSMEFEGGGNFPLMDFVAARG